MGLLSPSILLWLPVFPDLLTPRISDSAGWAAWVSLDFLVETKRASYNFIYSAYAFLRFLKYPTGCFPSFVLSSSFTWFFWWHSFTWEEWNEESECVRHAVVLSRDLLMPAAYVQGRDDQLAPKFEKPTSSCHPAAGRQLNGKECLCVSMRTWVQILSPNVEGQAWLGTSLTPELGGGDWSILGASSLSSHDSPNSKIPVQWETVSLSIFGFWMHTELPHIHTTHKTHDWKEK